MISEKDLGLFCILFEDLGFKYIEHSSPEAIENMTYHCYFGVYYQKLFADINHVWVLEVCLVPEELHIDRWRRKKSGLFIVEAGFSVDLHHPKSIEKTSDFVLDTIEIAHAID